MERNRKKIHTFATNRKRGSATDRHYKPLKIEYHETCICNFSVYSFPDGLWLQQGPGE